MMQNNGTLAGHYVWDAYKGKKYICELPSEVIKTLNQEYGVEIEKAKAGVFKIVPTATARNFGETIRTRGVPKDLGVDVGIATMIEDVVRIQR